MKDVEIYELRQGIDDFRSIMDYEDIEQMRYCNRNITELKQKIRKILKRSKQLS